jgi:hypothetical protein
MRCGEIRVSWKYCPRSTKKCVAYAVTRIKRNPCLGWKIFKIGSKQMRDICFIKFGNTVKIGNCLIIVLL